MVNQLKVVLLSNSRNLDEKDKECSVECLLNTDPELCKLPSIVPTISIRESSQRRLKRTQDLVQKKENMDR